MASKRSKLSVEESRDWLRSAGLRCTSCRLAVLQHVATASTPLSHADVAEALVPDGFDKSTIYRCLVELADCGFFTRLDLGDHAFRYEMRERADRNGAEHPHFMCLDCGKVSCLPDVKVRIASRKGRRAVAPGSVTEILLKGHCAECQ